jgi:plastocyanin
MTFGVGSRVCRFTGAAVILAAAGACAGSSGAASGPSLSPTPSATPAPEVTSTTNPASAAPAGAIALELAGPPPHFVPTTLTGTAGNLVFFLKNTSEGIHTLAIGRVLYKPLAISAIVPKGQAAVFKVHGLRAGAYVTWCTIDDHAAEGMVGTLTLK